jgi:uncharacterized protein
MPGIARILRGADQEFFDFFDRAGENIVRAADLLDRMLARYPDSRELIHEIRDCEQNGDRIVHEVIRRMNQTFVTPIDREDILDLTSALDDIVDYIEEVADYLEVYKVEAPMEQSQRMARILLEATRQIGAAIPLMRGFRDANRHIIETHRLENEGDRVLREAVGALFEEGTNPMVVIRWKDIFERLENAIDATEKAASIIEGIIIKNA